MPKPIRVSGTDGSPKSEPQLRGGLSESHRDPETVAKRRRRVFSAADKPRIVKEADRCLASGERGALGALLRREGLYSSLVSSWRTQLGVHGAAGLAAQKAGRKPKFTEAEPVSTSRAGFW
jgi:transposase